MNHKELDAWKRSIDFVVQIYKLTKEFPSGEFYGLSNQLRRASVSIASNIAEGSGRNSSKEFVHFLHLSLGSLSEVETQLIIGRKLNYFQDLDFYLNQLVTIRKPLTGLIKHQKNKMLKE